MNKPLFAVVALFAGFVATPAFATEIDFRSSAWAAGDGRSSYSQTSSDGVTVTVSAGPAPYADLSQDSTDGFGVSYGFGYEGDEIEARESLTVSFSESVLITDVFLTDLFIEADSRGRLYPEIGFYTSSDGTVQFQAIEGAGTNGQLTLSPDVWADAIVFTAPGLEYENWAWQDHEFSVAGINYTTQASSVGVPELDPGAAGTALLLVVGAGLMLSDRQRRSQIV